MPFIVPTLNITCNVWRRATWGATRPLAIPPPDLAAVPCQLRGWCKNTTPWDPLVVVTALHELVLPAGTDVRDPFLGSNEWEAWPDIIEAASGSSRWFFCVGVADQAKGFSNEYRSAILAPTTVYEGTYWNNPAHPNWPYAPNWPHPYP